MTRAATNFSEYLTEQFANGSFLPGTRLPTERAWAQQFGISRGTVRRVLKSFEAQKLITSVMGSGTFVLPLVDHDNINFSALPLQPSPSELLEARLYIEPIMPELIVRNAHVDDFNMMEECLARSEAAQTTAEFEQCDQELHRLFAVATHNSFFVRIMDLVGVARSEGGWQKLKERSYTRERHQQYMQQHREIVEALKNRDLAQSRRLMTEHLVQIRKNVFGD